VKNIFHTFAFTKPFLLSTHEGKRRKRTWVDGRLKEEEEDDYFTIIIITQHRHNIYHLLLLSQKKKKKKGRGNKLKNVLQVNSIY
jgi:hypothetical protein